MSTLSSDDVNTIVSLLTQNDNNNAKIEAILHKGIGTPTTQPAIEGPPPLNIGAGFMPLPRRKISQLELEAIEWWIGDKETGRIATNEDHYSWALTKNNPEITEFLKERPRSFGEFTYSVSKGHAFLTRKKEES